MQSILDANTGSAPGYGADLWTAQAMQSIKEVFHKECRVLFVPTGTGANVLALRLSCQRHESIICSDIAHIATQESGSPEAVGCKLLSVPSTLGKVTPSQILHKLHMENHMGRHSTKPRVLSITQPTEIGTLYTLEELKELSALCKQEHLLMHVDGSRLYNAAAALNVSLDAIIKACDADILSLGGTKNGLMGAEALVIFNQSLGHSSDYLQKQTLQLLSKMRYLSAQYIPFFTNDLWHTLATTANHQAQKLGAFIQKISQLSLSYPVETNQIFFTAPPEWITPITENIYSYLWDPLRHEIRFVTSWNTSDKDIEAACSILQNISYKSG